MFVMQPVHRRIGSRCFFSLQHCPPGLTVEERYLPRRQNDWDRSLKATIPLRIRDGLA
jgi:hypothetical protein